MLRVMGDPVGEAVQPHLCFGVRERVLAGAGPTDRQGDGGGVPRRPVDRRDFPFLALEALQPLLKGGIRRIQGEIRIRGPPLLAPEMRSHKIRKGDGANLGGRHRLCCRRREVVSGRLGDGCGQPNLPAADRTPDQRAYAAKPDLTRGCADEG